MFALEYSFVFLRYITSSKCSKLNLFIMLLRRKVIFFRLEPLHEWCFYPMDQFDSIIHNTTKRGIGSNFPHDSAKSSFRIISKFFLNEKSLFLARTRFTQRMITFYIFVFLLFLNKLTLHWQITRNKRLLQNDKLFLSSFLTKAAWPETISRPLFNNRTTLWPNWLS